ncbi:DUF4423 domain-containing protein [Bdellovibrio svalbardensis]|uniref:DUF4423 domain-containing protein n=1 Tax=Bdellovibrio svalbardensis TaxID=2972972 RepID=A0ABT6DEF9_9BACT|nr:DUF4423 domain-containing protein [Bdellovibrio svalbardensis]MDG0815173.1 DUF4423 domain-containing protein [Bdellovibrio svalbardensis]
MEITVKNLLLTELAKRQTRNSSYSLRAFARDLNIGVTTLSDVLADKRSLSKTNLQKVMERLLVSPLEKEKLWSDYKDQASRPEVDDRTYLDEMTFRLIADWHYIAILNLAKIKDNQATPAWIAERLGIKKSEAEEALERLLSLNLVKKTRGRMTRTTTPIATSRDIPSAAIRKHHSQNLQLAEASLHRDPVHTREFGSITMPVNPEKLPQAKELLTKTRKKIADLLEDGAVTEVYTLSFQLFPITKLSDTSTSSK